MSMKKVTLGSVCRIEKGNIGILKAIPGEYPMVVTAEERKSHNEYQFDADAVIIPLVSGTGHGHASIKRIHFQSGKFALGTILCAVIPKNEQELSAEYLYHYLDFNKENELVARMKGMANVTLPMKEIANIELPLPSIAEQQEFVIKYKRLKEQSNSLSTESAHQLNLVKQLRQSFLREAMQGKLVAQNPAEGSGKDLLEKIKEEKMNRNAALARSKKEKELPTIKKDEIPFEIPENWVWCRLGEIIIYSENLDIQKLLSESTIINYIDIDSIDNKNHKIREVKIKRVSELSTRARRVLKSNYILYSTVRPYLKNIAIIENELPNFIGSTGFNVFKTIIVELKYIFYFLLSPNINEAYKQMMVGFNSPSITNEQFENTLIPLPPLPEQERIVTKLDQLMQVCDALEQSIQASREQNEKLLQQVLREALRG